MKDIKLIVPAAEPVYESQFVPKLTIESQRMYLDVVMREVLKDGGIDGCRAYYRNWAEKIADALQSTLPQGLVDALLGILAQRLASTFCVSNTDASSPATKDGEEKGNDENRC